MAELWIKIRHNLASDPKVLSISQELGVDVDLVVGKLVRLWVWLDIVRESEQIPRMRGRHRRRRLSSCLC